MRVLIVEDDSKVASFISKGLKENSFAVDTAHDGQEGLYLSIHEKYDMIILDILLPKLDGREILRELRSAGKDTPVILLTAKDAIVDRVEGLNLGADDYLVKPFVFSELLARIHAVLRRKRQISSLELSIADLHMDISKRTVCRGKKKIDLTPKEFALLEYLIRNKGEVVTRTMISESVWNYDFDSLSNVVDVFINHLRDKIDRGFEKPLIHTVRGAGYVMEER